MIVGLFLWAEAVSLQENLSKHEVFGRGLIEGCSHQLGISIAVALILYASIWRHMLREKKNIVEALEASVWFIATRYCPWDSTFPVSEHFSRIGGVAITSPLLSLSIFVH